MQRGSYLTDTLNDGIYRWADVTDRDESDPWDPVGGVTWIKATNTVYPHDNLGISIKNGDMALGAGGSGPASLSIRGSSGVIVSDVPILQQGHIEMVGFGLSLLFGMSAIVAIIFKGIAGNDDVRIYLHISSGEAAASWWRAIGIGIGFFIAVRLGVFLVGIVLAMVSIMIGWPPL